MQDVARAISDSNETDDRLLILLRERFGLQQFRLGQEAILRDVLAGSDALAVMPTGGGKSLCYQLPSVYRAGLVLVISPLIALMRDQVTALKAKGIAAGCLHSGMSMDERRDIFAEVRAHSSYLLYLSPERVQKDGFQPWFQRQTVSLIAIDEAHCVSQWGPDFREDYYKLGKLREWRSDVPILALTATATPLVIQDIRRRLNLREVKRHVYGFYRPNLYYQVEDCADDDEKSAVLRAALEQTPEGRIIIYCGTRQRCEEMAERFSRGFQGVGFYHAGMSSDERRDVEGRYTRGELRILAATNAFGMGVDHADVRLVVHLQIPANLESYYQEVGRAGRDGNHSTCLLLYAKRDKGLQSFFIRSAKAPKEILNIRWKSLEHMVEYAEGGGCRHAGILHYFRDKQKLSACGHCDVCDPASTRKIHADRRQELAPARAAKPRRSRQTKEMIKEGPLSREQELKSEVIRQWRLDYAQEHDVPAFIVFSNKALEDLIRKDPHSLSDLEKVYGFGPQKVETFGRDLLTKLEETRGGSN